MFANASTPPTTFPSPSDLPSDLPSLPDPTDLPSTLPSDPIIPAPSSPPVDVSATVHSGDCVRIIGRGMRMRMVKEDCLDAPYKVLKRISGTSDKNKCLNVRGSTTAFSVRSRTFDFLKYVVCLRSQ